MPDDHVDCKNCGCRRSRDLKTRCAQCGSRQHWVLGYVYAHEARNILIRFMIVVLVAAGAILYGMQLSNALQLREIILST
jgi:uncharacterized membrane protein YvbJ